MSLEPNEKNNLYLGIATLLLVAVMGIYIGTVI